MVQSWVDRVVDSLKQLDNLAGAIQTLLLLTKPGTEERNKTILTLKPFILKAKP